MSSDEPIEREAIFDHLRAWAVKAFFLAFMLAIVPPGFGGFVRTPTFGILADPVVNQDSGGIAAPAHFQGLPGADRDDIDGNARFGCKLRDDRIQKAGILGRSGGGQKETLLRRVGGGDGDQRQKKDGGETQICGHHRSGGRDRGSGDEQLLALGPFLLRRLGIKFAIAL